LLSPEIRLTTSYGIGISCLFIAMISKSLDVLKRRKKEVPLQTLFVWWIINRVPGLIININPPPILSVVKLCFLQFGNMACAQKKPF